VGKRPVRSHARGGGDPGQGCEYAAGEDPPSHETEHQQESQHYGRGRTEDGWAEVARVEGAREVGEMGNEVTDGHAAQQEHPHSGEQQGTGHHEESRVAQGEFEANAQTERPIDGSLTHVFPDPSHTYAVGHGIDAVADAGHGGDQPGFAEPFA
jgi:hypothetical protein